jgi:hypothetical protein
LGNQNGTSPIGRFFAPLHIKPVWSILLILGHSMVPCVQGASSIQTKPLQHSVGVVNIEVPVRVFRGDGFIGDFSLEDFELSEDGVPQRIEALYLVKDASVDKKEEIRSFSPDIARHFYLFFICHDYSPKIRDAVDYFVGKVLRTGDRLVVVTPRTTYDMKKEILGAVPRDRIAGKLLKIVRKDILAGDAAYRAALNDLKRLVGSPNDISRQPGAESGGGDYGTDEGPDSILMKYRTNLQQLEQLRSLDEDKLLKFSDVLKVQTGQKFVFLFYQREFLPVVDKRVMNQAANNPRLRFMISELMELFQREPTVDIDRLRKAYADSSIAIHFLYLTTRPDDMPAGQAEEHSEDIFVPFANLAQATGGLMTSSSNAAYMMEKAAEVSENYYLLYYSPQNRANDGGFREIKVRVKRDGVRVSHRAGYFAK